MPVSLTPSPHRARGFSAWWRGAAAAAILVVPLTQAYAQPAGKTADVPPLPPPQPQTGYNYLNTQEQRQFDLSYGVLTNKEAPEDARVLAAAALLDSGWAVSLRTLVYELEQRGEVGTQRAIARAVTEVEAPSPRLIRPLVNLLNTEHVELRRDAATALGRYDDEQLIKQLIGLATGRHTVEAQRRGAIRALAEHRKPAVIETLLKIAAEADRPLRLLAFESLARLTGINGYGENLPQWQAWWQRVRKLDDARLLTLLLRNVSARNADANQHIQKVTSQLVGTYVRLYDATVEAERAAVLNQMLQDPMVELRLEGLKLVERRLLNVQPIDEPTRELVRGMLMDDQPTVRVAAAKQLETMADADGVGRAVSLLADEPDESVQRAFLSLLARVPTEAAVDRALERVADPALRGPAMAVIVAAADAGKVSSDQAARALARVGEHLESLEADQTPDPMALRLLGRLGGVNDEPRLANWLQHPNTDVKRAAADALAADRWPLRTLLDYLADPDLGPFITQVVGRRGSQVSELVKLLAAEPAEIEHQRPWREAAIAICTRLDTEGLIALDQFLNDEAQKARWPLYESMLTAAANLDIAALKLDDAELVAQLESRRWEADYLLARFLLDSGQPAKVTGPISRLLGRQMVTDAQKRRLELLQLSAMLHNLQQIDAEAYTSKLLSEAMGPSADTIAQKWIEVISGLILKNSMDDARGLHAAAARIFNGKLSGEALRGMADLRQALLKADVPDAATGAGADTPQGAGAGAAASAPR